MVLEIRKPIYVWKCGLGILENQIIFGIIVLEFINQCVFGIMVLEFRKPIYFWRYGLGI